MKIKVTKEIIKASNLLVDKNNECESCLDPISIALTKQTDYHGWFVSSGCQAMTTHGDGLTFDLPENARFFLTKWENKQKVKPFCFSAPDKIVRVQV